MNGGAPEARASRSRGCTSRPALSQRAPTELKPSSRYDRPMAETEPTLQEQLEEIGAQLDWVREYL
jgi:hypothetical protein